MTDDTPKHGILLFYQDTVNKSLVDYWGENRDICDTSQVLFIIYELLPTYICSSLYLFSVSYHLLTGILDRHWSEQNVKHCHCDWSIIQLQMVSDNSVTGAPFSFSEFE